MTYIKYPDNELWEEKASMYPHDMSEAAEYAKGKNLYQTVVKGEAMRYIPPETKRRAAYDDGQRSMTPYIVGSALVGLLIGFFVGRVVT